MAKKILFVLSVLIFMLETATFAQNPLNNVAYVNTKEILNALPDKIKASEQLTTLSNNYKTELQLMQNEYNKKYSDFITYQNSLAENIKLRRMQELTELENKIQQFVEISQKDIEEQEKTLLRPLTQRIYKAVNDVGTEQNFVVIYDLADPGIAFVSPNAVNANHLVKLKLGIR